MKIELPLDKCRFMDLNGIFAEPRAFIYSAHILQTTANHLIRRILKKELKGLKGQKKIEALQKLIDEMPDSVEKFYAIQSKIKLEKIH
jgi:hypothetical protein